MTDQYRISALIELFHEGKYDELFQQLQQLIELSPDEALLWKLLGSTLLAKSQYHLGIVILEKALTLSSEDCELYTNLAFGLNEINRQEEAEQACRKALAIRKDFSHAYNNLGLALHKQHRFEEAEAAYRQAMEISPNDASVRNNLGSLLRSLGRIEEANNSFSKALKASELPAPYNNQTELNEARFNIAHLELLVGRFKQGWQNYEARLRFKESPLHLATLPQWRGEPNSYKDSLLIYAEQGLGDMVHFARFLPELKQRFSRVACIVYKELHKIFELSFPDIEFIPIAKPIRHAEELQKIEAGFHWGCPFMSLPLALGIDDEKKIPNKIPYLKVLAEWAPWANFLEDETKPKIGIVWESSLRNATGLQRSISLEYLVPLLILENYTWVSLQYPSKPEAIASWGDAFEMHNMMDRVKDFSDTAKLISMLDLIITVDTSVAHIAGALGKPVWLLNRFDGDWRWLKGRQTSPWYPSMRIFTQTVYGDWPRLIEEIAANLTEYFPKKPQKKWGLYKLR